MPLTRGTRLAQFEIVGSLGSGGMGDVYRAHDTTLGRHVALKMLPEAMVSDDTRLAQFDREAKLLATLSHPNIVTIFSVEHRQGVHFFTMELVEGTLLSDAMPHGGWPLTRLLHMAMSLADALSAAHEKGIVHRDLKPANVMIDSHNRLKVLDFGLAKQAIDPATVGAMSTHLTTEPGVVQGTLPYMAPEQLCLQPTDVRSDIFSFGVVLYEMATGARPFRGSSWPLMISAILRDEPSPISERRPDLPPRFAHIVSRCLEKRPRDRYQAMRDVHEDLHALANLGSGDANRLAAGRANAWQSRSLSVRRWRLTSSDQDLQIFTDGLTEDVATGLSRFPYLSVVAADASGVRYSLEGSLRKLESTIRVSAQLVDGNTGTRLWAETYDRDLTGREMLAVQDELTDGIVATVADVYGVLVQSMVQSIREMPIDNLSSADLLLRFWAYMRSPRREEHAVLRTALEHAIVREPHNAEILAAVAVIYGQEYAHGLNPLPDSLPRAVKAARTAIDLEPRSQHAWEVLGATHFFNRDHEAFWPAVERAISLNPRNTNTIASMALYIVHTGETDRAVQMVQRARMLNPNHPGWYHVIDFHWHYLAGRDEEAYAAIKRVNMPDVATGHILVAAVCGQLGRRDEARAAITAVEALEPALLHPGIRSEVIRRWMWTTAQQNRFHAGFTKALELAAR